MTLAPASATPPPLPSPAGALCTYFGACGGCKTQDVAYADQLAAKAALLAELFAFAAPGPLTVTPSPTQWHYRNKVEFKFDRRQYEVAPPPDFVRETVLGFRQRGQWYSTLDLEECRLFSPVVGPLLAAVRAWYRATGQRYYDTRGGGGLLQHLVVREGKRTGERLVLLITGPGELDGAGFVAAVRAAIPVTSIWRGTYSGTGDVATADHLEHLWGEDCLRERLELAEPDGSVRALTFHLSPLGFFQTNTLATELLYGHVRQLVRQLAPPVLYDLYGGAGTIALACADLVPEVVSVESFAPATADGEANVARLGVRNIRFVTRRVEGWLGDVIRSGGWPAASLAVVDPPRSSLHPKALRRLVELGPANIIYISCQPKLCAQELPTLLARYRLRSWQAFDLFPHTPHVELVLWLERREDWVPPVVEAPAAEAAEA